MANDKQSRPKARTVRGFRDRAAGELAAERAMLDTIRRTYESYGFDALETPFVEYTDALGKFLPDVDRPNAGVFSFRDDDEQWVSLRYDLTAPLARYVAENQQFLPRPFRRYQIGTVFRNDKPGPGRYREFIQCDADTVGTASPSADAEMVMMFADTLEALGLQRGDYAIKVSSRKILDGLLESIGIDPAAGDGKRGIVLRAVDKLDRLGPNALYQLLTTGRKDDSGDFTEGAGLLSAQADNVLRFLGYTAKAVAGNRTEYVVETIGRHSPDNLDAGLNWFAERVQLGPSGQQGLSELGSIAQLVRAEGYGDGRVHIDPTIVRGLDYYTGAVFEAQLTFPVQNEKGQTVVFGSVGGGGRYDDLVARFTGQKTPAVGFSIGVSRLLTALQMRKTAVVQAAPLVVVTVMDKAEVASSFAMVRELRAAGIRAEAYVGTGKLGDQFKYADKRHAALAIVEGSDERASSKVTIKDLALGAELAKSVESRADWVANRDAQITVDRAGLVAEVRKLLTRGH